MPRSISIETPEPEAADLSRVLDRAFVFDDFFPETQRVQLERWALQTPHWMLTNSSHDEQGRPKHRIWGASYIGPLKQRGWPGLPPTLFAAVATLFQRLRVVVTAPEYVGLNGQSRGQDGSVHTDCAHDAGDQLSLLVYIGEDTDGDLMLFDKDEPTRLLERIEFRPNRVVAFDGSIPHAACGPTNDRFRMSAIVRGTYEYRGGAGRQP